MPKSQSATKEQRSAYSDDELRATLVAYVELQRRVRDGERPNKTAVYKQLADRFRQKPGRFERRMQNISDVLASMGREPLSGLKPLANTGTGVARRIEALINELEGNPAPPNVTDLLEVLELAAKPVKAGKKPPAPPEGALQPARATTTSLGFARIREVKVWVLKRAAGRCECCSQPAPFKTSRGYPFLEVHHLRTLADNGSDRTSNAVALCPNCHRRLHFGEDAEACKTRLYASIPGLVRE